MQSISTFTSKECLSIFTTANCITSYLIYSKEYCKVDDFAIITKFSVLGTVFSLTLADSFIITFQLDQTVTEDFITI